MNWEDTEVEDLKYFNNGQYVFQKGEKWYVMSKNGDWRVFDSKGHASKYGKGWDKWYDWNDDYFIEESEEPEAPKLTSKEVAKIISKDVLAAIAKGKALKTA